MKSETSLSCNILKFRGRRQEAQPFYVCTPIHIYIYIYNLISKSPLIIRNLKGFRLELKKQHISYIRVCLFDRVQVPSSVKFVFQEIEDEGGGGGLVT